jgi:hypothetical protein
MYENAIHFQCFFKYREKLQAQHRGLVFLLYLRTSYLSDVLQLTDFLNVSLLQ